MADREALALKLHDYAEKSAAYQRLAAQARDFSVKSFYLDRAQRLREFAKPLQHSGAFSSPSEANSKKS
jgi:hypothetical protein